MGVITGFQLIDVDIATQLEDDEQLLEWIVGFHGAERPADVPDDFERRSTDIDKSWDDVIQVLHAIGWSEIVPCLTSRPREIANDWGIWLRVVDIDDTDYLTGWLANFDRDAARPKCVEAELIGPNGRPLHETGMLDYTLGHIEGLGQWLGEHHRDRDCMLISTQ
jgi:hypothetical protein